MSDEQADSPVPIVEKNMNVQVHEDKLHAYLASIFSVECVELLYWVSPVKSVSVLLTSILTVYFFSTYRPHVVVASIFLAFIFVGLLIRLSLMAFKTLQHSEVNHPYIALFDICSSALSKKDSTSDEECKCCASLCDYLRSVIMADDLVRTLRVFFLTYLVYTFNGFMPFHCFLYFMIFVASVVPMFYHTFEKQTDDAFEEVYKVMARTLAAIERAIPPQMKEKLSKVGLYTQGEKLKAQ